MRLLLDADVLIGALDANDPHHAQARELFTRWRERQDTTLISVMNLTEVLIAPAGDSAKLSAARKAIAALGVAPHEPSQAIGVEAARLRHRHPISLPDAYCLATAKQTRSTPISFDRTLLNAAKRERITAA